MTARYGVRILLVDDHPMFRRGLVEAIAADSGLHVVGEAGSGEEALDFLRSTRVDVAVLDVTLPKMDGLELAARLLGLKPPVGVVLLTMHNSEQIFNAAIDLGVQAYILKDEMVDGVIEAVRKASRGEPYVSPSLSGFIMRRGRQSRRFQREVDGLTMLTPTERSILKRVAEDKSSREIATELFISPRTVGTHRSNISTKLGLNGSHSLLSFALLNRSEILSLPD